MHINLKATLLVIKDIDEHEILSNFTLGHKLKKGTTLLLLIYISQSQ